MSYSDYPQSASNNAERALKYMEDNNVDCATRVGKARANQLVSRESLSLDTVKRTYSYLSRAKEYDTGNYEDGCGSISYDLWGGDPMLPWTEKILRQEGEIENMKQYENKLSFAKNRVDLWAIGDVGNGYEDMDARGLIGMIEYARQVRESDEEIVMNIMSGGGSLFDAMAFYDYVKSNNIKFTAKGYGIVGSAATIIMCAAEKAEMGENGTYFVHNAYYAIPEEYITEQMRENLSEDNKRILDIYMAKCGDKSSRREVRQMMTDGDEGRQMTSRTARQRGFIDTIMKTTSAKMPAAVAKLAAKYQNKQSSNNSENMDLLSQVKDALLGKRISEERAEAIAKNTVAELEAKIEAEQPSIEKIEALTAKLKQYEGIEADMKAKNESLEAKLKEAQNKLSETEAKLQEAEQTKAEYKELAKEQKEELKESVETIENERKELEEAKAELEALRAKKAFAKPATKGADASKGIDDKGKTTPEPSNAISRETMDNIFNKMDLKKRSFRR